MMMIKKYGNNVYDLSYVASLKITDDQIILYSIHGLFGVVEIQYRDKLFQDLNVEVEG